MFYEDGDRSPHLSIDRIRPRRRSKQAFMLKVLASGQVCASLECEEMPGQLRSSHVTTHSALRGGVWAHVACVVGRGLLQVYVNGIREAVKEVETHCRGERLFVGGSPTMAGPEATAANFDVYTAYMDKDGVLLDLGDDKKCSPDRVCRVTHVRTTAAATAGDGGANDAAAPHSARVTDTSSVRPAMPRRPCAPLTPTAPIHHRSPWSRC